MAEDEAEATLSPGGPEEWGVPLLSLQGGPGDGDGQGRLLEGGGDQYDEGQEDGHWSWDEPNQSKPVLRG